MLAWRPFAQGAWTKLKDTLATRCIVLPHDCFSWQPRQQKRRNKGVSSPDCQTWHRGSSGPGRRPCSGGWGCYPSSRSLSRTEPLPPEDRPLWSEETQTQIQTRGGGECFVAGQSDWTVPLRFVEWHLLSAVYQCALHASFASFHCPFKTLLLWEMTKTACFQWDDHLISLLFFAVWLNIASNKLAGVCFFTFWGIVVMPFW